MSLAPCGGVTTQRMLQTLGLRRASAHATTTADLVHTPVEQGGLGVPDIFLVFAETVLSALLAGLTSLICAVRSAYRARIMGSTDLTQSALDAIGGSARSKLAASGHSGCFGCSEMGGVRFLFTGADCGMAAAGKATAARWPCDWPVCGE